MKLFRSAVLMAILAAPLLVHADSIYNVSLNTSAVSGSPLTLLFQFTDGSGSNDANNTATVTGLDVGSGGSAFGSAALYGGATGSAGSGFALTDSSFFNAAEQQFVAGSQLSFVLDLTGNSDGITPDEFTFSIEQIATTDPGGALAYVDVGGIPLTFTAAGNGAPFDNLGAPIITASVPAPVPEPSSLMLLLSSGGLVFKFVRRNRPFKEATASRSSRKPRRA